MGLEVAGRRAVITENDSLAREIENGSHLLLWGSNVSLDLWVDQYDVRMLLGEYQDFQRSRRSRSPQDQSSDEELNHERYQDLACFSELDLYPKAEIIQSAVEDEEEYIFPSEMNLPSGISVPKSQKLFNIIAHTTKSVRVNPQLEVLLRLRQTDNPTFLFLTPGEDFYPFYQVSKATEK
jgi:hypothetical protein